MAPATRDRLNDPEQDCRRAPSGSRPVVNELVDQKGPMLRIHARLVGVTGVIDVGYTSGLA